MRRALALTLAARDVRVSVLVAFGVVAALALGCARPLHVQPYGQGRYLASYGSILGQGNARGAALRDANAYCGQLGTYMTPLDDQTTFGPVTSYGLIFTCGAATTAGPTVPTGSTTMVR
jgi:hypothetical protein